MGYLRVLIAAAALSAWAAPGDAFLTSPLAPGLRRATSAVASGPRSGACSLRAQAAPERFVRRDALGRAAGLAAAFSVAAVSPAPTWAEDSLESPIVVFGASGGTGAEVVDYSSVVAEIPTRAVLRAKMNSKGKEVAFEQADATMLAVAEGSVLDPVSVAAAVKGARAVVFAASASKKGGDAEAVDYKGLLIVAKACIDAKVPRLVVVSSGAVSKPDAAVYQLLNTFGKIMYWKKKGEDEMKEMYKANGDDAVSYTVVRPGGLGTGAGLGPKFIELNQGDEKTGKITRADVAAICVQCIEFPGAAGATFECYSADSARKLETVAEKLPFAKKDGALLGTGRECRGETWPSIFGQLEKDA